MIAGGDEELLAALGEAIGGPPSAAPSETELAAFRAVLEGPRVLHLDAHRHVGTPLVTRLAVAAAVAAAAIGVTLAVTPLPSPIRSIAVSIGLPVNDAQVAAVKGDVATLSVAVIERRSAAVHRDASVLRAHLRTLGPADREKVAVEATKVLAAAAAFLRAEGSDTGPATPATTSPPAPGNRSSTPERLKAAPPGDGPDAPPRERGGSTSPGAIPPSTGAGSDSPDSGTSTGATDPTSSTVSPAADSSPTTSATGDRPSPSDQTTTTSDRPASTDQTAPTTTAASADN